MFKRDWGSIPEFVILIVTVLASAMYLFLQSGYGPSQRPSQQYEASQYAARADHRISVECTQGDIAASLKCANEIDKAYREQHTSDRDLSAQQYMAIWAFLMAVAGFGTLAVTWIGIVYIRRTLDQTVAANEAANRAVKVAREVGNDQLRAYVEVDAVRFYWGEETRQSPYIKISVKNFGQTPAKWFEVRQNFGFYDLAGAEAGKFPKHFSELPLPPTFEPKRNGINPGSRIGTAPGPFIPHPKPFWNCLLVEEGIRRKQVTPTHGLLVYGEIRYCTIFDEIFISQFFFGKSFIDDFEVESVEEIASRETTFGKEVDQIITERPQRLSRLPIELDLYRREDA